MRLLLSITAVCAALAAQDKASPNRFVPKDSCLVVHMASPARWQSQFAKTQVAKLLQGQTLAPLITQASAGIDEGIAELRSSGKFDADLIEKLLSEYQGEMVFSIQVDFADLGAAIQEGRTPAMSGVLAMTPDGKYDLAAFAAGIEKAIETEGGQPLHDHKVGDRTLRFVDDSDMKVAVPTMVDGQLVWLFSTDLEKSAEKLLAADGRFEGGSPGQAMFLHANLAPAVSALMQVVAAQAETEGAPFDVPKLMRDVGFGALNTLELQIGAEDKHVATELNLSLTDGDTGMFGMMLLDQGMPKLLRYVPAASEHFSVSGFDLGALYRTAEKVWTGLGEVVPMSFADAQAAFVEEMKVRLKEDLLDHMGTEMMSLTDLGAAMGAAANAAEAEDENPMAALAGTCLGLSLRNGKAFGESLEKMLRARGLHASRKSEDYQGTKVYRLRPAGVIELEYAVVDDLLLLAIGGDEASRRNLRAVLDARAAAAAGSELPEHVQKVLKGFAEGWSGVGITPIAGMLDGINTAMTAVQGMGDLPEEAEMVMQVLTGVSSDLTRLGLQNMTTANYTTRRSLRSRMRW